MVSEVGIEEEKENELVFIEKVCSMEGVVKI